MRFKNQRAVGLTLFLVLSAAIIWAHKHFVGEVRGMSYLTGWALFAVMILLTIYNGRKKIPVLPLFSSEAWLQFHIYAGLLTGTLFIVHVSYKIPHGWFQGALAWLYIGVMASGIVGWFFSREIPRRLTARGGEVLFERIPSVRSQLREQTQKLALESIGLSKSGLIADFYWSELSLFFADSKNCAAHLLQRRRPLNELMGKIGDVNRYLSGSDREAMDKIAALVRQKDALDYHYSHQLLMKLWLFVHIPLTYSLLIFTLAHIVIVYAFSGGVR